MSFYSDAESEQRALEDYYRNLGTFSPPQNVITPQMADNIARGAANLITNADPTLPTLFPDIRTGLTQAGKLITGEVPLASGRQVVDRLFGTGEGERYQTWPEQIVRSGGSLAHDVATGKLPVYDPETEHTNLELIHRVQDMSAMAGGASVAGVARRGIEPNTLGVVPVPKAKELNVKTGILSEELARAVENTPGAKIDPDGHLIVNVTRRQHPDQEMSESIRGGVFYLPQGSKDLKYYTGKNENFGYGGSDAIAGETAYKNPLVVKGATGGKAPEAAYDQLLGKGSYQKMRTDALRDIGPYYLPKEDRVNMVTRFLDQYAPELSHLSEYIFDNTTKGNQRAYALQEAAVASAVRKAGHDGVVGYSVKRDGKSTPFISEIFDVRENRYPSSSGDYSIHPQFLSDTSQPGAAIAAANRAPRFYSAVENAVNNSKTKVASAEQWLGELRNQPGVKQEELDWVLHELPQGKITKVELEQFVQEHKVELKEVTRGENTLNANDALKAIEKGDDVFFRTRDMSHNDARGPIDAEDIAAMRDDPRFIFQHDVAKNPTKYSQWQLPGGENYSERLLTLPDKKFEDWYRSSWDKRGDTPFESLPSYTKKDVLKSYKEETGADKQPGYISSHWDEPNVLAHIRTNERNVPGVGNNPSMRSLHVEEIQSDWHQAGRKQGYKGDRSKLNKLQAIDDKLLASTEDIYANPDLNQAIRTAVERKVITPEEANYYQNNSKIDMPNAVPDAPFKSNWADLALKRIIREAAESGHDAISWTPGEAQAARYDLSKEVSRVYLGDPVFHGNNDVRGNLIVTGKNGNDLISKPIKSIREIEDTIGKEAADRLVNDPTRQEGRNHVLDGDGLKVGGEGMKAFYDKMLVDKANALAKKFGGKVEQAEAETNKGYKGNYQLLMNNGEHVKDFNTRAEAIAWANEQGIYNSTKIREQKAIPPVTAPIHVLRIPQALRDTALSKGFSLFADTGKVGAPLAALTRVDHNPFTTDAYHGSPNPLAGERIRPMSGIEIKPGELASDGNYYVLDKVAHRKLKGDFKSYEEAQNWVDKNALADFYSTPNPRLANDYAMANRNGRGKNITPLKLDTSEYHTVDANHQPWDAVNQFAINEANQLGKKGVIVKNVFDDADPMRGSQGPQTVFITLDPSTVRGKFAKFDPKHFGESGLLKASGLPVYSDANGNQLLPPSDNPARIKALEPPPWLSALGVKAAQWTAWIGTRQNPVIANMMWAPTLAHWIANSREIKNKIAKDIQKGRDINDIMKEIPELNALNKLVPVEGNPFK